jgi:hypothetical protein
MPLNDTAKNLMLDALGAAAGYVSAHTADPGEAGDNEVAGGTYAREAITWDSAYEAVLAASNQPVIDIPASTTVSFIGLWSLAESGTFYGAADVDNEAFTNAGTYTVTSFEITASDPA